MQVAVLVFLLLSGCSSLTVTPKPVTAHAVSFDQNVQNGGIVDCDQNGCIVTSGWMQKYRALEARYEPKAEFLPDRNIKSEGGNYRISFEVSNHGAELHQRQRNDAP